MDSLFEFLFTTDEKRDANRGHKVQTSTNSYLITKGSSTVPVLFTWVLRICWIRTNLEIQEHSMLYKLSSIQKHQEQFEPVIKLGKVNPGSSFEKKKKKTQGMGIQPFGTSSGSILKLLLFLSFYTSSRKIPFASLFYMIFCFIWNSQNCSMFPVAFVAGWLQGHWWGFISRNYVVWPTFLLMNVFIALKGSHFWFLFDFTAAGVVPCGGRKTSPCTSTIVQFIFYFGPLRSAIIFWEIRNKWLV